MELEEMVVVTTARVERRVADEPLRVEVVDAEEIEEKTAMTPGDVAMLLNETGGLRVQPTAPGLGRASVRVQGQLGRYTLVLADALPLYGEAGAVDVMQVPPMDLGRVEVVKGPGSALYGGPALAGVVNLVSRRPDGAREVLVNATSRGGFDAVGWVAGERTWSLLAGVHGQPGVDVDGDGWADMARYRRWVARPRLHFGEGTATSAYVTGGVTREERSGGTMAGDTVPSGVPWEDGLTTTRYDLGGALRRVSGSGWLLRARGSAMQARYERTLGPTVEASERRSGLLEATASRPGSEVTWLVGAAVQYDRLVADSAPVFSYTYTVPGLFGQVEWTPAGPVSVSASARYDRHSRYGDVVSPRLAALLRLGGPWTLRASAGSGYFGPGPYLEETDAVGLRSFAGPLTVRDERGAGGSVDLGGAVGPVEVNASVFASRVAHQVWADLILMPSLPPGSPGLPVHANAPGPTRNGGVDLLARWRHGSWQVTASYTYLDGSREQVVDQRAPVPLNARHAAGAVMMWERGPTRLGAELYYVGRQHLDGDPYRAESADYVIAGLLVMRRVGRAQLFLNLENLGDVRQTRWAPLVRPAYDERRGWTTDAWAPLEGRVVNGGVRWRF
jgi:iron complex outermembrane receptor protein